MVGVAYLLVAVIAPLVILQFTDDSKVKEGSRYRPEGIKWSLIAGTAGAIGALGIILAYNNGGTPVTVMPIVFGFAPVVATLFTIATSKLWDKVSLPFFLGIGLIIVGMVIVLKTAPHPSPPKKKPVESQETAAITTNSNTSSSTGTR
jgi:drug/metabolite transporter (DMT)-like permease